MDDFFGKKLPSFFSELEESAKNLWVSYSTIFNQNFFHIQCQHSSDDFEEFACTPPNAEYWHKQCLKKHVLIYEKKNIFQVVSTERIFVNDTPITPRWDHLYRWPLVLFNVSLFLLFLPLLHRKQTHMLLLSHRHTYIIKLSDHCSGWL